MAVLTLLSANDVRGQPAGPPSADILAFEATQPSGAPEGWVAQPENAAIVDDTVRHSDLRTTRIEHVPSSGRASSTLRIDFLLPGSHAAKSIEVRAFARGEHITGEAALVLAVISPGALEPLVAESARIAGDAPWQEVSASVALPVSKASEEVHVTVAAGLTGPGRMWIGDVRILVGGKVLPDQPLTVNDLDLEFEHGSGIRILAPDANQIESLALLAKVWGYLKYHHPEVTGGHRQWDFELLRFLPTLLAANDAPAARTAIADWVEGLGPDRACPSCTAPVAGGQTHLKPRLDWLRDEVHLGSRLSRILLDVHTMPRPSSGQFYVRKGWVGSAYIGNAFFDHELSYPSVSLPDAGFQLIALFRFWNAIEYWFPYRNLIEQDWDSVLRQAIPRVLSARGELSLETSLLQLIATVQDGHVNMFDSLRSRPPYGDCAIPIELQFVGEQLFVKNVADNAHDVRADGVQVQDEVRAINGRSVPDLVSDWSPYYAASNRAALLRDIARNAPKGECGKAALTIRREGAEWVVDLRRVRPRPFERPTAHDVAGPALRLMDRGIAYLKLSAVRARDVDAVVAKLADRQSLIIDLRGYPGDYLVHSLGGHFITAETTFAQVVKLDIGHPGRFAWAAPITLRPLQPSFAGRLIVLVDEVTWSQAEFTAMAFRASPRALVVGRTTAGSDGDVSFLPLPFGLRTQLSGNGYFLADRRPTQKVGIVPDIDVRPTVAGLAPGRDDIFEAALGEILGRPVSPHEMQAMLERSEHPIDVSDEPR